MGCLQIGTRVCWHRMDVELLRVTWELTMGQSGKSTEGCFCDLCIPFKRCGCYKTSVFFWWNHRCHSLCFPFTLFKFRKCSLVVHKRLRSGLKAQQAHSPGHRPGLCACCPFFNLECLLPFRDRPFLLAKLELLNSLSRGYTPFIHFHNGTT